MKEVWGSIHMQDTHYLRIFVRKLRQKIEPNADSPKILATELGVGYRLDLFGGRNGAEPPRPWRRPKPRFEGLVAPRARGGGVFSPVPAHLDR